MILFPRTLAVFKPNQLLATSLTAYAEVYGRHANALEQAYESLNLSPFGAAALGTSSYPINRERLSELLGFERPIHNSYDAVLLSSLEINTRLSGAMAGIAITTNQLVEDLGNQYYLNSPLAGHPTEPDQRQHNYAAEAQS